MDIRVRQKFFLAGMAVLALSGCRQQAAREAPARDPLAHVDPFIGTGGVGYGVGMLLPGAVVPYGTVKLSPDTMTDGAHASFQHTAGYWHLDNTIRGFSHLHLVGTGGSADFGTVRVMPIVAEGGMGNDRVSENGYASPFRHDTETASPGYYAVTTDRHSIRAELTASVHTGYHRYTFPATDWGYILLDIGAALDDFGSTGGTPRVLGSSVTVLASSREVVGWQDYRGGMAGRCVIYFAAEFAEPFTDAGVWSGGAIVPGATTATATTTGAFVRVKSGAPVELKVGISFISVEQARLNRDAEVPAWGFDAVRHGAEDAWRKALGAVEIWGGTEDQATIFYTALYHLMMMPTIYSEVGGMHMSFTADSSQAPQAVQPDPGFPFYSDMSLWDTFRTYHSAIILIDPDRQRDFVRSLIAMGRQAGVIPKWPAAFHDSGSMIGKPANLVIAESVLKGIRGFDAEEAYALLKHTLETDGEYGQFALWGYVPGDVSATGEYAYHSWGMANLAGALGKTAEEEMYRSQALHYRNTWDPSVGYMRGRNTDGTWFSPFNPVGFDDPYTEGTAEQWSFYAPQDPQGLIALYGGRAPFLVRLENFLSKSSLVMPYKGAINTIPDTYYWHGNEPDIHAPFFFNDAGRPDRAQYWTKVIMRKKYSTGPEGIAGNDDGGTLSAWYIFNALGFYPQAGGDLYWVGSPVFQKAVIHRAEGDLTILSRGSVPHAPYVRALSINGRPLERPWFSHADIAAGGTIVFDLQDSPSSWGAGTPAGP